MSPRRSSRARTTQPPPTAPVHTNSSGSSTSLTKADRSTRSNMRGPSPKTSSTQRSESLDDADSRSHTEPLAPRRSRRGNDKEDESKTKLQADDPDGQDLEEEVTRCICGQSDYPGPPASIREAVSAEESISEDLGNFFVQCDNCQVWQHGGCMELIDESTLPEQYYCEQCKPEFHKITRVANGSRSSRYLPVLETSSRSTSLSASRDSAKKKESKARQLERELITKRRATTNSRLAIDEEEMFRQAIEESREMGTLGKRGREDDDDIKHRLKRQRTSSTSPSDHSKRSRSRSQTPDNPDGASRSTSHAASKQKHIRGAAARNHREKELRDQQKQATAAQRAEAASKRNARSERRRVEDSPPPSPSLSPSKGPLSASQTHKSNPADSTLPPHSLKSATSSSHQRKTGRPPARRGRLGRNQYTRDPPLNGTNGDVSDTPGRDTSNDNDHNGSPANGHISMNGIGTQNGLGMKSSKAKVHGSRTSMNEMKRRVAAILEFVGRMQGQSENGKGDGGSGSRSRGDSATSKSNGHSGAGSRGGRTPLANGMSANGSTEDLAGVNLAKAVERGLEGVKDKSDEDGAPGTVAAVDVGESETEVVVVEQPLRDVDFRELPSVEMMQHLRSQLLGWQNNFGRYGDK